MVKSILWMSNFCPSPLSFDNLLDAECPVTQNPNFEDCFRIPLLKIHIHFGLSCCSRPILWGWQYLLREQVCFFIPYSRALIQLFLLNFWFKQWSGRMLYTTASEHLQIMKLSLCTQHRKKSSLVTKIFWVVKFIHVCISKKLPGRGYPIVNY